MVVVHPTYPVIVSPLEVCSVNKMHIVITTTIIKIIRVVPDLTISNPDLGTQIRLEPEPDLERTNFWITGQYA